LTESTAILSALIEFIIALSVVKEIGSRFEDGRSGTNPEEIMRAAHAACFMTAFSFACSKAGQETKSIETKASVRLSKQGESLAIDCFALTMEATGAGITDAKIQEIAAAEKRDCPPSKAFPSFPEVTFQVTLR
jgi:osmotically inducible protein OsmC